MFSEDLLKDLRRARFVAVLTGAGVSAESGVPTFRDAETGLWKDFNPDEVATPEAFARDSKKVWEWYQWRREQLKEIRPNPAHLALAKWEQQVQDFTLITQNIDNLHQAAGSRRLLELHGNLTKNKCFEGHHPVEQWQETGDIPPRCPHCGGRVRPDVVWFGEMLPMETLRQAVVAAQRAEIFLSIGTSAVVEPAALLPWEALRAGATVVEINPEATELTAHAQYFLQGKAGEILPSLVDSLTLM